MRPVARRAERAILDAMTHAREPTRLALEVRFDREPIEGRLSDVGRDGRLDVTFCGWLGLMAAIERARGGDRVRARDEREA